MEKEFVHFYIKEDWNKWCSYTHEVPDDTSIVHPTHISKEELEIIKYWAIERAMAIIDKHI